LHAPRITPLPMCWVMLGTFVVTLDFFAINATAPALRDALALQPAQLQWVVAAFGLMFGCGLIAGARLGDRHGTERVLGLGLALFAPQALLAIAGALRAQPWRSSAGRGPALDGLSVALLALGTMALVAPLIKGRHLQWPAWLLALPLVAAFGFAWFWRRQRH